MRISDALKLKWSEVMDNRLHYAMSKNDKVGSIAIPAKAQSIIDSYPRGSKNSFVFPFLQHVTPTNQKEIHKEIKNAIKRINRSLEKIALKAQISKPLTTHIARHTFGNISGDKISPHMLQKLYRHSSLSTTIGYQANFIHRDADEALEAVIGK